MNANYKMTSVDYGIKYKGFALEGEFYWRWLSNFTGPGTDSLGFNLITDNGFQAMVSYMIIQQKTSGIFHFFTGFWRLRKSVERKNRFKLFSVEKSGCSMEY